MVIDNLRARVRELENIAQQRDRAEARLKAISDYDRLVQGIIKSNANLEREWDSFRVLYQLVASDKLLATAHEKIQMHPAKDDNSGAFVTCPKCHRLKYDDPLYPSST